MIECCQQSAQLAALFRTIGEYGFRHHQDARGIGQRMAELDDDLHAGQEDPLQPLLEAERIDRERYGTGQRLIAGRLVIPPALHLQLTLDEQQVVGDIENALLDRKSVV